MEQRKMLEQEPAKEIWYKWIKGACDQKEEKELLLSPSVTHEMLKQWSGVEDYAKQDGVDPRKIWKMIGKETRRKSSYRKNRFYVWYSKVATIALLIGLAGMIYFNLDRNSLPPIYVVTTGIRNIEPVVLPDGTTVQLGPGSKLVYPERFTGKERKVTLDGQAFFNVEKDNSCPFLIQTHSMEVEVLGTAFELFSYSIENRSEAILFQGKIRVNLVNPDSDKRTELILLPNDKIEYNLRDKKVTHTQVNADTYTSWRKRGILTFENESLSMIIPRLEQWYGRKIICEKEVAGNYKFTFKVRDEPLDRILFMMQESSPIRYRQSEEGDFTLYVSK